MNTNENFVFFYHVISSTYDTIIVVEVWFGLMFLQDVLTILTCAAKKLCVVNNDRNQTT